jgi:FAD/FMN-containing dehydrogenase
LRNCVPPSAQANVLTEGDLGAYEQDWRKRRRGKALAVVRPGSTAEVAAVVRLCAAAGTPIIPQGGNTSMVVGSVPDASGREVVLSLTRLNRIRAIDGQPHDDRRCRLRAAEPAKAAEDAGFLFPLSLAAEGSCTIGGNLGTNAGGTQVVRYGNTRELCLGLEVVTAQGELWEGLSGLRKDNTGYDLRDLFIGSEGTLGIITAATMKLYPLPAAQLTAWAAVPSLEAAVKLLGLAHKHLGAGLTGFEVMGQFALGLVVKHMPQLRVPFQDASPYCALLENSDTESEPHARAQFERLLEAAMEPVARPMRWWPRTSPRRTAVARAREHPAGAGAGRLEHQARHLDPGVAHSGFLCRDRRAAAAGDPRRAAGELRAPGRRQPALQRAGAGRRRPGGLPARAGGAGQRAGVRRR